MGSYTISMPPSSSSVCPVMPSDSAEPRYTARSAISRRCRKRERHAGQAGFRHLFEGQAEQVAVGAEGLQHVGLHEAGREMAVTLMPCAPISNAAQRVNPTTACFDAL